MSTWLSTVAQGHKKTVFKGCFTRGCCRIDAACRETASRQQSSLENRKAARFLQIRTTCIALLILSILLIRPASADIFSESPPPWEPLLWGGAIASEPNQMTVDLQAQPPQVRDDIGERLERASRASAPEFSPPPPRWTVPTLTVEHEDVFQRLPYKVLSLRNIPPLYTSPVIPGEGIWEWKDMPPGRDGWPILYRTTYRPSAEYPNATVHMLLLDMKHLTMELYLGSTEPGGSESTARIEPDRKSDLVAITNALWKQRHSGNAGSIYRGKVIRELAQGVATLVAYKDGSVDILEWNNTIPVSLVNHAKQLRHLIVKDGQVVGSVVQGGQTTDSEIGLGYLLVEEQPSDRGGQWGGYWGYWGGYGNPGPLHTSGVEWFLATRSAFGIRPDGNLVFAVGHHISTKDLAKALVLAGCVRGIHGDANPFNVLGNLYYVDRGGNVYKKAKLSPDQNNHTLTRYVGSSYASDFFAFFLRHARGGAS